MRTTAEQTAILVDVLDRYGYETGRTVFVYIDYLADVDDQYGADVDGNRGERRVEYQLTSIGVDPGTQPKLLQEELAQVICDGAKAFASRTWHH